MKKAGILNSEISRVLSYMGHTDLIAIGDCGLSYAEFSVDGVNSIHPDGCKTVAQALILEIDADTIFAHALNVTNMTLRRHYLII